METIGCSVRASIDFNGPINALSTSPSNRLIAVGGRDVLKIVALESSGFTERRNLRVGKANLSASTNDIRWHPQSDTLLATAATNGSVVIWNLQREGFKHVQERVLSGHRRAVNRICWHPTDGNLLISGSQDGTIKLWDKRAKVANTYQPKSESVRDVCVSPFQFNKFAAAFENGIVQVWDIRKNAAPEQKFQSHKGLVLALEWHPTKSNLLASGGRDRYVKVWDLGDVRQPRHTIQTIASVGRVTWRPNCGDHIASSASIMDNSIHIWDIQRPCIPIASMKGHTDVVSGLAWLDTPVSPYLGQDNSSEWEGHEFWQHVLACSKDGTLKLHSLADSFKPHQSLPTTAIALNSRGQIAFSHDYVDRSCASLKTFRHFSFASPLFNVTDPATAATLNQSSYDSGDDGLDLPTYGGQRSASRMIVGSSGHPPPRPSSYLRENPTSLPGIVRQNSSLLPHSQSMQMLPSSFNVSSSPGASSAASSPNPSFFASTLISPRALVSLVSMQNTYKATQLERIFAGFDTDPTLQEQSETIRDAFAHEELLKDAFGFDEEVFRFLANHYIYTTDEHVEFSTMCGHNALAAFVVGNDHVCQMWRILDILFGPNHDEMERSTFAKEDQPLVSDGAKNDVMTNSWYPNEYQPDDVADNNVELFGLEGMDAKTSDTGIVSTTQTAMLLQQLDHVNPQAMRGFDPYPYDATMGSSDKENQYPAVANSGNRMPTSNSSANGSVIPSTSNQVLSSSPISPSTMIIHGSAVHGELGHIRDVVLKELLEYYVDLGDLQTCVVVALVVNHVTSVEAIMGKEWLQQIYMHYIDLLHQMRIYRVANELILNCPDPSIRQMNMRSTSVYTNCSLCTKPFETMVNADGESVSTYLCSHCNSVATRCSVCQLPARGLYVWCPVCAHGGHLEHMTEWFRHEEVCPTGCSHRCSLGIVDLP